VQDGSPRRLDTTHQAFEYGIGNGPETNIANFTIVDALAAISLSKKTAQVVAIALRLNPVEGKINPAVAENKTVRVGLKEHPENIWRQLGALASIYENYRGAGPGGSQSPEALGEVGIALRASIFRDVYTYYHPKESRRVDMWAERLADFVTEMVYRNSTRLEGPELTLLQVATRASTILNFLQKPGSETQATDKQLELFLKTSMYIDEDVAAMLKNGFRDRLADEVNRSKFKGTPPLLIFTVRFDY